MVEGTGGGLAGLLGLEGFEILAVEREADGSTTVHVVGAVGAGVCCPGCGVASSRVRERRGHTVRHLVVAPMRVTWDKRVLACDNTACARVSFVEDGGLAAPGGRVSAHGLDTMGHLIGDGIVAVDVVARWAGVSWQVAGYPPVR